MRSFSHLTPRYIANRCLEMADHRLRPDDPWLTREAIGLLDRLLKPNDVGLEFGSGRSSIWFARKIAHLTSIEHQPDWYRIVMQKLNSAGLSNLSLQLHPIDVPESSGQTAAYVRSIDSIRGDSIDFVLIDGVYRGYCALESLAKLKSGGIVVVDNANWYLPSTSISPNARSISQGPADEIWGEFAKLTGDWRRIWTSSGVTDTVIIFKP